MSEDEARWMGEVGFAAVASTGLDAGSVAFCGIGVDGTCISDVACEALSSCASVDMTLTVCWTSSLAVRTKFGERATMTVKSIGSGKFDDENRGRKCARHEICMFTGQATSLSAVDASGAK